MATISKARRFLLFPIELVLYPLAWTYEATLTLPSYQRFLDVMVAATADIVTRVLSHPAVTSAIAFAITEGMNKFLLQPDLDQHVKVMMDTMSNIQPEIARKKGEEFHNSVANFIQGILSPRKDELAPDSVLKPASSSTPTKSNGLKLNLATANSKEPTVNNASASSTSEVTTNKRINKGSTVC